MNEKIRTVVALSCIKNIGARRIQRFLKKVENPFDIFRMSKDELTAFPGIGPKAARSIAGFDNWDKVDEILKKAEQTGSDLLTPDMDQYPFRLNEIYDPPPLIWLKGDRHILNRNAIAVVGTRHPTPYGRKAARQFTRDLVENGLTVISGLAYGIDTIAHQTTLDTGGLTVAVLGSGIDNIYPGSNRKLAESIIENGGAVLSEFPPGTNPDAGNFPVRNRIVSGMSMGVLVVESGIEGGSMITARLALDQNREVFVIPHAFDTSSGAGCNYLIKNGLGKLVQDITDALSEIPQFKVIRQTGVEASDVAVWQSIELDEESIEICRMLADGPLHIDVLCEKANLPPDNMLQRLFELELMDCVDQKPGKMFALRY